MPFAGPSDMEIESTTGTFEAMTASKNNPQKADLDGKPEDRDLVAEICDLRQRLLNKCQLGGGKFCFFRRRKSFTFEANHFKNLRHLSKWY